MGSSELGFLLGFSNGTAPALDRSLMQSSGCAAAKVLVCTGDLEYWLATTFNELTAKTEMPLGS